MERKLKVIRRLSTMVSDEDMSHLFDDDRIELLIDNKDLMFEQ